MKAKEETSKKSVRVVIVAEAASLQFGGEAALPLHYYRVLRRRGIPVWLVVREHVRTQLKKLFPDDDNVSIIYTSDSRWHRWLYPLPRWKLTSSLAYPISFLLQSITQLEQRQLIRRLIKIHGINIVHQPTPVSPKAPSYFFGMGVPVIVGPMNGGMDYPAAFRKKESRSHTLIKSFGRKASHFLNVLIPGKRKAAVLLVANARTRKALPKTCKGEVIQLVENGVDTSVWNFAAHDFDGNRHSLTRYVFVGRLVGWKAVDLLLQAFKTASERAHISLTIIGDGRERESLEQLAQDLGVLDTEANQPGKVHFTGWLDQSECAKQLQQHDAMILPSLQECGGAVVLEAMCMCLPVIATNWGGPSDYLDPSCGILVNPSSRKEFLDGLSKAMIKLSLHPELRKAMGKAGQEKVIQEFTWDAKVDTMLEIYRKAISKFC
ncbi:glycosyltransferase family 4 protein [Nodosilinea nodulosa]|uniref:glycosyltransferase family 4 protein n=1 Tax=Nodosilinea nodulosa TaxID=416001 RepID=UPI0002E409FE|nr:glycosyltransferase family 4 protein [Nodosilinea nodulosa]